MPYVYQSARLKDAHSSKRFNIPYIKEVGHKVYVESAPEVRHAMINTLKMDEVDVILVSNIENFVGLPFYTEGTGFSGKVFMTDAVFELGKVAIEEMVEYFARIDFPAIDNRWKDEDVYTSFPNVPHSKPASWHSFYSEHVLDSCYNRVTTLSFNQTIEVFRIEITPICNGYSLGSANWTIKTENEKVGYLSASSKILSHVKTLDTQGLRSCDYMLISSMNRIVDITLENVYHRVREIVSTTLKRGGNVLLPISSVGCVYDLLEAVSDVIDQTPGISIDTPIYLISPKAKNSIALASISAEWMSPHWQNNVYKPEEPFRHSALVKAGRLKIYDSLYGEFSKEYKTPCVMFAGHSTLRIGDAAHMVEVWGWDSRNAVILTDPDLAFDDVRDPFKELPIAFMSCPMDFRLSFDELHAILADVKPGFVISPPQFMSPLMPNRSDLMLNYGLGGVTSIMFDEPMILSKLTKKKEMNVKVKVHPDIVKNLKFMKHPIDRNLAVAPINCHLSCYNNQFELLPIPNDGFKRKKRNGIVTSAQLTSFLKKRKLEFTEVRLSDQTTKIVKIPSLEGSVTIYEARNRIKITAAYEEKRRKIHEIITNMTDEDEGYTLNMEIEPI
ncbi:unnamed protein product [Caenorhabditis bovis]|uniref:Beta-Casp domain-containing protein n=1 Tax=Caenorhabditis bovis TaxID=2654633 RepID=A0A8S1EDG9_9PELO|nr:unnamed protein product [Caenorhabditis bovis]